MPQTMRSRRVRSFSRCSKKLGIVIESPAFSVNARSRGATIFQLIHAPIVRPMAIQASMRPET